MGEFFETAMIIFLGLSWPISVYKSWTSKTTKGKSLMFECLIFLGYVSGIIGKIVTHNITIVFIFYVLNLCMVGTDLCLYYRNWQLDRIAEGREHGSIASKPEI